MTDAGQFLSTVEAFLGVTFPQQIEFKADDDVHFFDEGAINKIIWEVPPGLFVQRIVIIRHAEKSLVALGTVNISHELCRGHFPFFPMAPLASLAQAAAQVGESLVRFLNDKEGTVPLVTEAESIRSLSGGNGNGDRRFIVPGDTVLIMAKHMRSRLSFHKVSAELYLDGKGVASIENMTFIDVDIEMLRRNNE